MVMESAKTLPLKDHPVLHGTNGLHPLGGSPHELLGLSTHGFDLMGPRVESNYGWFVYHDAPGLPCVDQD